MNTGLTVWRDGHGEKLSVGECKALAKIYIVGHGTVARWFGREAQNRNCVPLTVLGYKARAGRPARLHTVIVQGEKRSMTIHERYRCLLGACLLPGGLARVDLNGDYLPVWSKSFSDGTLLIYEETFPFSSLADCVREVEAIIDGYRVDRRNMNLALAWIRIWIEWTPEQWEVHIYRTYPKDSEGSDDDAPELDEEDEEDYDDV